MRELITVVLEIEHDCANRDDLIEGLVSVLVDQDHAYECDHDNAGRTVKAAFRIGAAECEGAKANAGF